MVAEIAVALILLAASGLFLRSFEKMRQVDLGFRPEHTLTASYSLPKQYATQTMVNEFNRELLLRLQQLPGTKAAGLISILPGSGDGGSETFVVDGYTYQNGANMNSATPFHVYGDSFQALGIPLLRGRFFTRADQADSQLVVIVNDKLAQHYWPNQDPVGKRLRMGPTNPPRNSSTPRRNKWGLTGARWRRRPTFWQLRLHCLAHCHTARANGKCTAVYGEFD